jgi:hypothetical protein
MPLRFVVSSSRSGDSSGWVTTTGPARATIRRGVGGSEVNEERIGIALILWLARIMRSPEAR